MSAPPYFTWDFTLPTRPARAASLDDLGGARLRDKAASPPIPPTMPYADQLNQWATQLGGVNRVVVALDLEVGFVAGSPVVLNVTAMSDQLTTSFVVANLSVLFTLAHGGPGDVTFGWAAGVLPPPRAKPRAYLTDPSPYAAPVATSLPNAVRVRTWDLTGTPTDVPFVVSVV